MARRITAAAPWHVIATGYSADDFIGMARGDALLPAECAVSDVFWFPTIYEALQHPAARDFHESKLLRKVLNNVDGEHGVRKGVMHSAKAREAERVKFDNVTDLNRLPYLAAEVATRTDGATLAQVADEVWAKHVFDATAEALRVQARRLARACPLITDDDQMDLVTACGVL